MLFFIASDITLTTRHIQSWVSFPLWPSLFILSGAISPLFLSSILDTYQPEGLIFRCHMPFYTVHGVLKTRILKRFSIPFSSGMEEFKLDDHYTYFCGQKSLRRNGVAVIVNKRVWNAVLGCNLGKQQNDLGLFPRKTIQHHSNPSLCPYHPLLLHRRSLCLLLSKKLKLISSMKTYNTL